MSLIAYWARCLEHAPAAAAIRSPASGLVGWLARTPGMDRELFLCATCAARIAARGCAIRALGAELRPVWTDSDEAEGRLTCSGCGHER